MELSIPMWEEYAFLTGPDIQWRLFCLKLDLVSRRGNIHDFTESLHTHYPPDRHTEFYKSLTAENNFYRRTYEEAFEKAGIRVLADGVVGSLAYGMATLTFHSDIDASVIAEGLVTPEQKKQFDQYLAERGIESNVRVFGLEEILRRSNSDKMGVITQLYGGINIAGAKNFTDVARRIISTIPIREFYELRNGIFDELGIHLEGQKKKYLERAQGYLRRDEDFSTAYYDHPEIFASPNLIALSELATNRPIGTSFARGFYDKKGYAPRKTVEVLSGDKSGTALIDLGAGADAEVVAEFAAKTLHPSLFIAIDKYHTPHLGKYEGKSGFRSGRHDMLLYLSILPDKSVNITANGIDEIILDTDGDSASRMYVWEILKQIARVVPKGGYVFGFASPFLTALSKFGFKNLEGSSSDRRVYNIFQKVSDMDKFPGWGDVNI